MTNSSLLANDCVLRPARLEDMGWIRRSVLRAKLDPTQLRWQQFWVIEYQGDLVACGQLRCFAEAQELGSIVVTPEWRDRGLGTLISQHLIQQATQPLYLECLGQRRVAFYSRLGFVPIAWQELPRSLKFKFGLSQLARILLGIPMEIMHYDKLM